jgi:hypothetical protein
VAASGAQILPVTPDSAKMRSNEQKRGFVVLIERRLGMPSDNERVQLEMKILRYRRLARHIATGPETTKRIQELIADLERQLREIDE